MREPLYFIQDLLCAVLRRYLMIHVICGILSVKCRFIKKEKQIAAGYVALSMAFYMAANYLSVFTLLLYGDRRGMLESRRSILPLLLNIALLLVYSLYFYSGKKSLLRSPFPCTGALLPVLCTAHEMAGHIPLPSVPELNYCQELHFLF